MELIIFLIVVLGLIFILMLKGAMDEKKREQAYRNYLKTEYGSYQTKALSKAELQNLSQSGKLQTKEMEQADSRTGCGRIDDITWNDCDMDQIFEQMNLTQSSAGEEYLYGMLRNPQLSVDKLEGLEEKIQYYMSEKEERLQMQMSLWKLGHTGKYSIYDYIRYISEGKREKNTRHYLMFGLLIAAFGSIFINTTFGVCALIVVACMNIVSYLNHKKQMTSFLTGFSYVGRLMETTDEILKNHRQQDEMFQKLQQERKALEPFAKHANTLVRMNASSGNPLSMVFDYVRMLTHLDLISFNNMMAVLQEHQNGVLYLLDMIGFLDSVIAIGAFRMSLKTWCVPELTEGMDATMQMKDAYHPLLKNPVCNDILCKRGVLVTGSNASGKSTFLKTVALNAILSQTIHTAVASEYQGGLYQIYSSMSLRDNITGGESYYMVEIKALKRIVDEVEQDREHPLLCFVDEVLRGTNTVERIAASTQILKRLSQRGIYCFAATHDIELTHLCGDVYDNYHFKEEIDGKDVVFSYKLLNGRAESRNAIKLLGMIGFEDQLITEAESLAERFLKSGQWKA